MSSFCTTNSVRHQYPLYFSRHRKIHREENICFKSIYSLTFTFDILYMIGKHTWSQTEFRVVYLRNQKENVR